MKNDIGNAKKQEEEGVGATYKVIPTCQVRRQFKLIRHALCGHDLVGPLPADKLDLVDLGPVADAGSHGGIGDGAEEVVGDGARVGGLVPLDLDGVACVGGDGLDTRGDAVAVDIAGYVVAVEVCLGWLAG
jgi:hypothetical protein